MDQFAFHDVPDSISYILATTHQPSLSYIGFSQGTAQAFASLSVNPTLNDKVDVFVGLAPAMSPPGLTSRLVNSLAKASPNFLFLLFGRRAILSSATMWEALLYPPIFVRLVDLGNKFLFGWHSENISAHQKLAAYPHLYSFTSTKSVVHWFQIIRNGKFQMYDDEIQGPFTIADSAKYYKVAKFPTRNIRTPIVLLYGGSDSLVNIDVMLKELPKHTEFKAIPHYEHLDFLWATDVSQQVFPHVFAALETYTDPARREASGLGRNPTLKGFDSSKADPSPQATDRTTTTDDDVGSKKHSQSVKTEAKRTSRIPALEAQSVDSGTEHTATSRPEGWWSSDDVGNSEREPLSPEDIDPHSYAEAAASKLGESKLASSLAGKGHTSRPSFESSVNEKGISVGAVKAVGGVSPELVNKTSATTSGEGAALMGMGSESEKRKKKKKKGEL
jgi:lysosomal acid lipase/cholesteryl ester hydrolase